MGVIDFGLYLRDTAQMDTQSPMEMRYIFITTSQ